MTEDFLQWVWEQRQYRLPLRSAVGGEPLEVLNPGRRNYDAGPDFFNAQVKIQGVLWAGNVELHLTSDDWYRHEHDRDPAYNTVILHVVGRSTGRKIFTAAGELVPEVALDFPVALLDSYDALANSVKWFPIRCGERFGDVPELLRHSWLDTLLFQRLDQRCQRVKHYLDLFGADTDQVFYALLARALGGKVNAEPMEQLAKALPLRALLKHANNPEQVEAMLFGVAGLLPSAYDETDGEEGRYIAVLRREFGLLQAKFQLSVLDPAVWKYARMRPQGFPDIRLAQLAAIIHAMPGNFASRLDNDADKLFRIQPSAFWATHYRLGKPATKAAAKTIGGDMRRRIVVNAIVPYQLSAARRYDDEQRNDRAIERLRGLPMEDNKYIGLWREIGLPPADEGDAQALIELTTKYCEPHLCLRCRFGHWLVQHGQAAACAEETERNATSSAGEGSD